MECQREMAQRAWQNGQFIDAFNLQKKLIESSDSSTNSSQFEADTQQLERWRQQLRSQAIEAFKAGEFKESLRLLDSLEGSGSDSASHLSEGFEESWNRNRLEHQRLQDLMIKESWWEALASLNRLDHPWWQNKGGKYRSKIEAAIKSQGLKKDNTIHGDGPSHTVSEKKLDSAVTARINQGQDAWSAFQAACADLGGRVVETGPESLCQR